MTLDLVKYYFSFSSIANGIVSYEQLEDIGLSTNLFDQWRIVREIVPGLIYQTEIIQALYISTFGILGRFPNLCKHSLISSSSTSQLLGNLTNSAIWNLKMMPCKTVLTSFEVMRMSNDEWQKEPIYKLLQLTEREWFKARYLQQWFSLKWLIKTATHYAVRQLPFEVKQYGSNGVVFENFEDAGIDKDCIILDSISMEDTMKNVYVTKEQLANHMKELEGDDMLKQDRRPTRMKLENQPFAWLPRWVDILTEMKKLCLSENSKVYLDVTLLKQVVTEYKSDNERKEFKDSYDDILENSDLQF